MSDSYNLFVPFYLSYILMKQLRIHNLPLALLSPSPRKNIDKSLAYCISRFAIEGYTPVMRKSDLPLAQLMQKRIPHLMYVTGDVDDQTFEHPIPVIMFAASYFDVIVIAYSDRHLYLGYIDYVDVEQHFIDIHGSLEQYLHDVQNNAVRKELAVVVVDFNKFMISKEIRDKLIHLFHNVDFESSICGSDNVNDLTMKQFLTKG